MFDFGANLDQAMQIILAYTGRVQFFGVSITQMIITVVAFPFVIYGLQGLWRTFSPVPLEFDPVTGGSDYLDEQIQFENAFVAEDRQNVDRYVNTGVMHEGTSESISRHRGRLARRNSINGRRR